MNTKILLFAIVLSSFTACSTAYRSGQTPDDVYFSPARTYEENRKEEARVEVRRESPEDRIIRRGFEDPRYRNWDYGYDYRYDPYRYGYDYGYYYNPYYYPYPVYNNTIKPSVTKPVNTTPRKINLGSYNNTNYNTNNNNTPQKIKSKADNATQPSKNYNNNNSMIEVEKTYTPVKNEPAPSRSSNSDRNYTPTKSSSSPSSSGGRPARKND